MSVNGFTPEDADFESAPQNGRRSNGGKPKRDHFQTDHLLDGLGGRAARGGAIMLAAQGTRFTLQLGSTMVLARLLTPADFGLIAMVTAVTGFVAMFKDAGLSMATVQRPHVNHEQVSMLFWVNVALSIGVMIVVAALAPGIARFYEKPELTAITLALAGTFVFGGLTVQHEALLKRQMRFKALVFIQIASMASGIGVAIAMAFAGAAYWALVALTATTTIVNAILAWLICDWRPGLPRRGSDVRPMLRFGSHLVGFNVVTYFMKNADNVLLAKAWGATAVGIYSKAYNLLMLPMSQVSGPLSSVMIPTLSRVSDDPERFRHAYRSALGATALMGSLVVGLCVASADGIIPLVLGNQWIDGIPIFRALAVAAFFSAANVAPGWVYIALGHTKRQFIWSLFISPLTVLAFWLALPWGALGVAIAFSIMYPIAWFGGVVVCFRGTFMRLGDALVPTMWPLLTAGGASLASLMLARALIPENDLTMAGVSALLYGATILTLLVILRKPLNVDALVSRVRAMLPRRGRGERGSD